jgi:hypothetical protein
MGTQPDINSTGPDDEQKRRDREAKLEELWALCKEIRDSLPDDVTSDRSWLYDDQTGLPR